MPSSPLPRARAFRPVLALALLVSIAGLTSPLASPAGAATAAATPARAAAPAFYSTPNLARDGGFEGPTGWSVMPGTRFAERDGTRGAVSTRARSGSRYGAVSASATGASIYQDTTVSLAAGKFTCVTARVRSHAGGSGAAGTLVLWARGGGDENGSIDFSGLGSTWREIRTCVQATANRTSLRVQLYPRVGGGTVDIDDVDVHRSIALDGGFEGPRGWSVLGVGTNFEEYAAGQVSPSSSARSGSHYGATNAATQGGSIYQDLAIPTRAGQVLCASAYVRAQAGAASAGGTLALWVLGGGPDQNGTTTFTRVGGTWSRITTCVQGTTEHRSIRIQLYPRVGGPTVDIDDIDVHATMTRDGSFEGPRGWSVLGAANFATYSQVAGTRARSGARFGAMNAQATGGSIYQDVSSRSLPGRTVCASAFVRTAAGRTGASGSLAVWLLGGSRSENGLARFNRLGRGWGQVTTCVQATTEHSVIRIQVYPTVGGPTLDVDEVDVH